MFRIFPCAAALALLIGLAGAAAFASDEGRADSEEARRVEMALQQDKSLAAEPIHVQVIDGSVYLSGQTATEVQKRQALEVAGRAARMPVVDKLTVKSSN